MSQTRRFDNPYDIKNQNVIMVPISDEMQTDQNLEPQMVRLRAQNHAVMHLDASEGNKINLSKKLNKINLSTGNIYTNRVKRIAFNALGFFDALLNVIGADSSNTTFVNNIVTFFLTNTGLTHTATVVPGRYETPGALMTALTFAMTNAVPATGRIFTSAVSTNPTVINVYDISVNMADTWHFLLTSPGMIFGRSLWNLSRQQLDTNSKKIGAIWLLYTKFIDFRSSSIFQYTKNPNSSNAQGANNILYRLFLRPAVSNLIAQEPTLFVKYINYNRERSLTNVDIELFDEFNNPLVIPNYSIDTDSAILWNIILTTEI